MSSIFSDTYDTDQVGNITQRGSVTFDYDALNRLDEEDDGSATTYTYDATHNRLTKVDGSTLSTTVPTTSNKISAVGSDSYSYDAAGNITDDGTRVYVWDDAGRLKEVEISSTTVGAYTYNASNQRAIKVASSVTTHYIYGAGGLLYGEYDSAGDMIREYIYLNGEPLTQINDGSPETPTYLHTDNLGTPRYGTSAAGSQVWAWDSDAFGNGTPSGSVTVNLRMAGQYHDAETGLFYNWNRYYNPEIGRYVSSDPIGLEGGINTFNYVEQNPLLYVDPEGLTPQAIAVEGLVLGGVTLGLIGCSATSVCSKAMEQTLQNTSDAMEREIKRQIETAKIIASASVQIAGQWCKGLVVNNEADDGGDEPDIQDLDIIKTNKGADKAAQESGFEDAHDAKTGRGESEVNIYKDKKTGRFYLWDGVESHKGT